MRGMFLGLVMGAVLASVAAGFLDRPNAAFAQRPAALPPTAADGTLLALPSAAADHGQLVTVIDPRSQAMSVYHVDGLSGRIKLMSVRNIRWDLQMMELNSDNPLPQEIRSLLEQR